MSDTSAFKVMLMGKEFRVACREDERDDLMAAARYLDEKMRQIRDNSRITGMDKIAVIAALNIAHELTQAQRHSSSLSHLSKELTDQIVAMQQRIDEALAASTAEP